MRCRTEIHRLVEYSEGLEILELYESQETPNDLRSANSLSCFGALRDVSGLRYIADRFWCVGMSRGAGLCRLVCWEHFTISVLGDLAVHDCAFGPGTSMRDLPRTMMRLGRAI